MSDITRRFFDVFGVDKDVATPRDRMLQSHLTKRVVANLYGKDAALESPPAVGIEDGAICNREGCKGRMIPMINPECGCRCCTGEFGCTDLVCEVCEYSMYEEDYSYRGNWKRL